ncbi:MAG: Phosphopantetheine attachment site [Planctomycetota bacterium]|jgi:acyl carrier protein
MPQFTTEDVLEIVRGAGTKVDLDALSPEADLVALGADSLDIMTILLDVQDRTGVEIPDEDVDGLRTAQSIVEYVTQRSGAAG